MIPYGFQLKLSHRHSSLCIEWVLWEHKASSGGGKNNANQWKENMSSLCEFNTIEEFWQNFNHIPPPSTVFYDGESKKKVGNDQKIIEEYSLFKKNIEPEWGDPANVVGGEYQCRAYFEPEILDLYWQNLVLAVIGGTLEEQMRLSSDKDDVQRINGVRVVDKSRGYPLYRLEVWVKDRDEPFKERLRSALTEIMVDGQAASNKSRPKLEWKDHSA